VNASLAWLNELLGTSLGAAEVRDRLAMLGAPVDAVEPLHQDLGGVLIGLVLEAGKHPNADRLSLCSVDAGGERPFSVVCGAPNVKAGAKYPFAPVGTVLPGGLKLERRKIRGEVSEGMLCSARELGLGEDGAGILELDTPAAPGTRFLDAVPLADTRLEIDVTPNRGDLLSHLGLARDLGAVLGTAVKLGGWGIGDRVSHPLSPVPRCLRASGSSGETAGVRVTIEDEEGCPRFTAAVIRGVTIGPSPEWLARRLRALGQRPINNVVDTTNYLMLENGQPLHAYDLAKLAGPEIVVRRARPGERLTTLDGQDRALPSHTCVIADRDHAVGVAGVMGGANSEVSPATTDVLLEGAYFDPKHVRAARKALGMTTEASHRFERGVDAGATAQRLERAVELLLLVAGGTLAAPPLDVYPTPALPLTIFLRDARVAQILGATVPRADIERTLTALGFVVGPRDDRLAVQVPPWRPDVEREIDLIEEVARIVGYDRFPSDMAPFRPGTVPDAPEERASDRLRAVLTGLGLHEAVTLSLGAKQDDRAPEVVNPLSQAEAFLRTSLLHGLAQRVEHNWRLMERDVRLFEIGHTFERRGEGELPYEELRVAGVVTGAARPPHWSAPQPPDANMFDVKAALEAVVRVACPGAAIVANGDALEVHDASGAVVGWAREVAADRPAWAAPIFGFEVAVRPAAREDVRVAPLPSWPAVPRDVALVLPAGVPAGAIEATLVRGAGPLLERAWVFDEYQGAGLPAGTRSVAWRLVFRAADRTLRDAEVDTALATALDDVERMHHVRRRAT